MAEPIRLQKVIAGSGLLSRRKAEEAITEGRVQVNGQTVTEMGTKINPASDEVRVDGQVIAMIEEKKVIVFHKPRKVVTTKSDPQGRRTVMDCLPEELRMMNPVGRLDFDSEGLLILTNDGELANRLAHPRYGVHKWYHTWVDGDPSEQVLEQLTQGVELEDGSGKFESVKKLRPEGRSTLLEVVVSEGRNRFVRRMFDAVGFPVNRLKRIRVGELLLGPLALGKYRVLSAREVTQINQWFQKKS